MEQHRTSQPPGRRRPKSPATPPGALVEGAAVYRVNGKSRKAPGGARLQRAGAPGAAGKAGARPPGARPVPPVVLALRRLPSPRLTGLGAGLFASAVMLVTGLLDLLLFDGSPLVYGLLFLPVSALTSLWVRDADLVTAPIGVPIAFAVGVVPVAGGTGGLGGQAMAVVTALAVHAGWLYGGTLVAGVIASVRKVREMGRRRPPARLSPASKDGNGAGNGSGGGASGGAPARGAAPRRRPVV